MHYYTDVVKKYTEFTGRAARKEYWMFYLFNLIITIVVIMVDKMLGTWKILTGLYTLGILLPYLAVTARRLHDTGRTFWWFLISFVPIIGTIVLLVFLVLDSQPGDNKYGPNPKGVSSHPSGPVASSAI